MNLVVAIIKPFQLEEVRAAVAALGVQGMTVSEAKGFGRQKGHTEIYRGAEYHSSLLPKMKLEIACPQHSVSRIVEAIQQTAHSGAIGDGKIFVLDLLGVTRIRTGETAELAL